MFKIREKVLMKIRKILHYSHLPGYRPHCDPDTEGRVSLGYKSSPVCIPDISRKPNSHLHVDLPPHPLTSTAEVLVFWPIPPNSAHTTCRGWFPNPNSGTSFLHLSYDTSPNKSQTPRLSDYIFTSPRPFINAAAHCSRAVLSPPALI